MCNPALILTGVGLLTSIGGSIAQYSAQSQAANQQRQYEAQMQQQQQQYQLEVARQANAAYANQIQQLSIRQQQEDVKTAQESANINKEYMLANSKAKAGAGEAGVSGVSVDMLLNDYARQRDDALNTTMQNREFNRQQASVEAEGMRADALGRPRQVQQYIPRPVQGPSLAGTAFGILGNVASTVGSSGLFKYTSRRPSIGGTLSGGGNDLYSGGYA